MGKVSLLAFAADIGRTAVSVRGAVGASARLSLSVSGGGHRAVTVARATSSAGFFALRWNRKFGGA